MSLVFDVSQIIEGASDPLLGKHESWPRVELRFVAHVQNGFAFKSTRFSATRGVPLIRIRDLGGATTERLFDGPYEDRYVVDRGDLLVGMDGDFKCVRWRGPTGILNQRVCRIVADPSKYETKFLEHVLPAYLKAIHENTSSQTVKHLSSRTIEAIPLPVPPLAEQRRIADRLDAVLQELGSCRDRLDRVPTILSRFRLAVLAWACSGRLTEDWRRQNPASEDATDLLRRIQRHRKSATRQLGRAIPPRAAVDVPDSSEKKALPPSWTWCRVGDLASVCLGGTPSRKVPSYWGGRVPWVSSGEVANCRLTTTRERLTEAGLTNSNAKLYPKGTVLIAMIGEGKTRGQSAILDIEACTNQNAAALVFDTPYVNSEYVWRWALEQYESNRSEGRGGNQPALNGAKVRGLPVPLAPLEEQAEIVRRVDGVFALADAVERRVAATSRRLGSLRQAVLSRAFRGELVSTEAELAAREGRSHESAGALLERTRQTMARGEGPIKARRRDLPPTARRQERLRRSHGKAGQ